MFKVHIFVVSDEYLRDTVMHLMIIWICISEILNANIKNKL